MDKTTHQTPSPLEKIPIDHRVFIYGVGSAGQSLFVWLKKCRPDITVLGFIDSFQKGRCAGKKIIQFDSFVKTISPQSYDLILIASGANKAIAQNLEKPGIQNHTAVSIPSYLMANLFPVALKEKITAARIKLKSLFCRPSIHLFFGEHGGKFIGNNKYFFLYIKNLKENLKDKLNAPFYWVVEDSGLYDYLKSEGIPVLNFKEKGFHRYLYKAAYFYFDNMTWQRKYPFLRFFKAKIIHMSHGVGLKVTEKMLIPQDFMDRLSPSELKRLDSRIFQNHLLISTSPFYAEKVSSPAYNTPMDRITCSGYPKNDLFYCDIAGSAIFTARETDRKIQDFKKNGFKIILYAPTFRDMDSQFRYAGVIDYHRFNRFLAKHRLLLVIKGHTSTADSGDSSQENSFSNILFYPSGRDGYPMMARCDLLITDYSSIYMDFLHSRKPVIFFNYDYDEYVAAHRDIQFDYFQMTPGPKAQDYETLTHWLTHFLVDQKDGFQKERAQILQLAFTHHDGQSSQRLFHLLFSASGGPPGAPVRRAPRGGAPWTP